MITNSSWDTRIAAAQTVESIVKNLNDFELVSDFLLLRREPAAHSHKLEDFDLGSIRASSYRLLGTSTQKYDSRDLDAQQKNARREELLRQQRDSLYAKLGIDVGGAAKLDTQHIFSDYDLIDAAVASADTSSSAAEDASSKKNCSSKRKEAETSFQAESEASKKVR